MKPPVSKQEAYPDMESQRDARGLPLPTLICLRLSKLKSPAPLSGFRWIAQHRGPGAEAAGLYSCVALRLAVRQGYKLSSQ